MFDTFCVVVTCLVRQLAAVGGVLDKSRKGRRDALFKVGGPWGVELVVDNDLETVHFSISVREERASDRKNYLTIFTALLRHENIFRNYKIIFDVFTFYFIKLRNLRKFSEKCFTIKKETFYL